MQPMASPPSLLSTVGWPARGETTYLLEGSVFMGGAVVQWLRDGLGLIASSAEVERWPPASRVRQRRRLSGAGLHRPRRARTGTPMPAAPCSA
jgi:glycerol kinase